VKRNSSIKLYVQLYCGTLERWNGLCVFDKNSTAIAWNVVRIVWARSFTVLIKTVLHRSKVVVQGQYT